MSKWQVLECKTGKILFEGIKEDCIKFQKDNQDINTILWEVLGMRISHL